MFCRFWSVLIKMSENMSFQNVFILLYIPSTNYVVIFKGVMIEVDCMTAGHLFHIWNILLEFLEMINKISI